MIKMENMQKKYFALCSWCLCESDYETLLNKSNKCTMEVARQKSNSSSGSQKKKLKESE